MSYRVLSEEAVKKLRWLAVEYDDPRIAMLVDSHEALRRQVAARTERELRKEPA